VRLYAEVARRAFRRFSTYRAATLAGAFTNTVFGFIQAYVMVAVFRVRHDVGGLHRVDALTFVFLTQAMIMCVGLFSAGGDVAERVKTGEIVVDLYRPVDFQGYWLAVDLGRAGFNVVARGLPPLLAGALVFDLRLPGPFEWAAFLASLAVATVASFGWRFLVALVTFWVVDDRGPAQLSTAVVMFFSGFIIPLNFFPDPLRWACRALPFVTMVQLPIEVFLGKHHGLDLVRVLAYQLLWAAVLLAAGRAVLPRATRQVEALGG
jgi:ABC-2 type transport system permease protein